MEKEIRYKQWMEKLTQKAVEKALQDCSAPHSRHSSETESGDFRLPSFLPRSTSVSGTFLSKRLNAGSKYWSLDANSPERRNVAAGIYEFLLQWGPDISDQWASNIAAAVPVFEQALYQSVSELEDYKNTAILDVHLRQILRQFESGNGSTLLSHQLSKTCHSGRRPDQETSLLSAKAKSVRTHQNIKALSYGSNKIENTTDQKGLYIDKKILKTNSESALLKENWHPAIEKGDISGNLKEMSKTLINFPNNTSRKSPERVVGLLSLKKEDKLVVLGGLQKGLKVLSSYQPEVKDRRTSSGEDSQCISSGKSIQTEHGNHLRGHTSFMTQSSHIEVKFFSDEDVDLSLHQCVSAEKNLYSSQTDLRACAISSPLVTDTNQKPLSSQGSPADLNAHEELGEDLGTQQRQLSLKSSTLPSSTLSGTDTKGRLNSVLSGYAESDHPMQLSRDGHSEKNSGGLIASVPQDHKKLTSLGLLFQLDDSEVHATEMQSQDSCHNHLLIESMNVENINDLHPTNTEQVARDARSNQTDSIRTADDILNVQRDAVRVSLLSLLRERHHVDGRVSLMSLLRERDDVVLFDQSVLHSIKQRKPHDEDDHEPSDLHSLCCVCMVGQRGAAFIPCGHTFCRKCAYELEFSRGTCPLCNRGITQILKLY